MHTCMRELPWNCGGEGIPHLYCLSGTHYPVPLETFYAGGNNSDQGGIVQAFMYAMGHSRSGAITWVFK